MASGGLAIRTPLDRHRDLREVCRWHKAVLRGAPMQRDRSFGTADRISRVSAHIRNDQEQRNGAAGAALLLFFSQLLGLRREPVVREPAPGRTGETRPLEARNVTNAPRTPCVVSLSALRLAGRAG